MKELLISYELHRDFDVITNFIMFVCIALAISALVRSQQRVHLQWLIPLLIDTGLEVLYPTVLSRQIVIRTSYSFMSGYDPTILFAAKCIGVYGIYKMYHTFKTLIERGATVEPTAVTSAVSQEGVWPPPPTK